MDMKPDIQDCQSNEQLKIPPEEVADRPGTWTSACDRHPACTVGTYRRINTFGVQTAAGVGEGYYNRDKLPHSITSG